MQHIDILIHILCLLSGFITAILGYLLYLKYRIKSIRDYTLFILTTSLTVATTTVLNYSSSVLHLNQQSITSMIGTFLFALFLLMINYTFAFFALGIINKRVTVADKLWIGFPGLFVVISMVTFIMSNLGKTHISVPPILGFYFSGILFFLFLTFILYSVRIARNLKNIDNLDLKRALKVLALLFGADIPIQACIIVFNRQWTVIMLSRNLFYMLVNVISIVFAAKYFFIETPSIMDRVEIGAGFIRKYAITNREKEVVELLMSGLSIKEIAGRLDRSFKTVNNHIYHVYQKTGVGNKLELLNLIKENQF